MEIVESEISCGIQQLTCIGENPTLAEYESALQDGMDNSSHEGLGCFIIASVPWKWKNSIKFLKSIGFSSNGVRRNPNSQNKIVLLSKTLSAKERKHLRGNSCKDCGDKIPSRQRYCYYCKRDRNENRTFGI